MKKLLIAACFVGLVFLSGCKNFYSEYAGRWSAVATDADGAVVEYFQFTIADLPGRMMVFFTMPERHIAQVGQSAVTGSLVLPYAAGRYLVLDTYHVEDHYFSGFTFEYGHRSCTVIAMRMQGE